MFLVAGELIDSVPVVKAGDDPDEWSEWVTDDLREGDPSLPSRLLGPPPFDPVHYGVFYDDFLSWRANRPLTDYSRHIATDDAFVLVADMEGTFGQFDFDVSVGTVFVPSATAAAFVRSIQDTDDPFYAKAQSLHYATILPELEADIQRQAARYGPDEIDKKGGDASFRLRPVIGQHHQELDFHRNDSRWKSFSRNYPFPSTIVQRALGLRRYDPLGLTWSTQSGAPVVTTEIWHDGKADHDVNGAKGFRMLLSKPELARLLERTEEDIVFVVTLRRQTSYSHRRSEEKGDYDRGTIRGQGIHASADMSEDAIMVAKAKAIMAEMRLQHPTILQTWMVHCIAECIVTLEVSLADTELRGNCAETIAHLWDMRVREELRAIDRGVDDFRRRAALSQEALTALRSALESPDTAPTEITGTSGVTVWQISVIEQLALEVLWASSYVSEHTTDEAPAAQLFAELRQEGGTEAQKTLGALFPSFQTLVLLDQAAIKKAVTAALREIDRLRRRLIWDEVPLAEVGQEARD